MGYAEISNRQTDQILNYYRMAVISTILTVVFIILCILLVLIILIQSNRSSGMSLFGGGSNTAFGASSADVITKATGYMVVLFFAVAMAMPFFQKKDGLDARKLSGKTATQEGEKKETQLTEDKSKGAAIVNDQKKEENKNQPAKDAVKTDTPKKP